MSKGRPSLFGERLKANGLSKSLDDWYHAEAKRRTDAGEPVTVAALKRIALEDYRTQCEFLNMPIETLRADPLLEADAPRESEMDNSGEVEL